MGIGIRDGGRWLSTPWVLYGIRLELSVLGVVIYGVVRDRWDAETAMLSQTPQLLLGLFFLSMVRLPKNVPQPPSA